MFYWLFLIIALAFFILSFKDSGWELMSPVPLMLLGLAVADILAIVGRLTWNEYDMSVEVFTVEALGVLCLFLGAFAAKRLYLKRWDETGCKHRKDSRLEDVLSFPSDVCTWKWVVLGAIILIAMYLRITETYQLAAELGKDTSSYSAAAKAVRNAYAGFNSSDAMQLGTGFSLASRQLTKAVSVIAYFTFFSLAKHIISKNPKGIVASSILAVLCCVYTIITGSRGEFFYYIFAFVFFFAFCQVKQGTDAKRLSLQILGIGAICAVFGSVLFWASSALVGRKTNSGLVEYISFYFGCGFPSLQAFQESGASLNSSPGTLTFYYLLAIPYKFFHIGSSYPSYSISWMQLGSHSSNIFTGFARFYLDFGYVGIIILSALSAFLMTLLNAIAKKQNLAYLTIATGYIFANAFDFAREEFIFSRFLSSSTVVWLGILFLIFVLFNFEKINLNRKNEP